jgi:hypothetical protein
MIRGGRDGMNEAHCFFAAGCRGDDRGSIGILLQIPFSEGLVIPSFAGMKKPRSRIIALAGVNLMRGLAPLIISFMVAPLKKRN